MAIYIGFYKYRWPSKSIVSSVLNKMWLYFIRFWVLKNMNWLFEVITYPPSKSCEQSLGVERGERVQLLQRHDERLHRRRVHEVEVEQVVDAHGLQL